MGVVILEGGEYAKELAKWEQHQQPWMGDSLVPGNPPSKRSAKELEYPKMLYKAIKKDNGQYSTGDVPDPFASDIENQKTMAFNKRCYITVFDQEDEARKRNEGWSLTGEKAMELAEKLEIAIAQAAAERHHAELRMSERARREAQIVDDASSEHVPEIPRTPVKRRGRPAKVKTETPVV